MTQTFCSVSGSIADEVGVATPPAPPHRHRRPREQPVAERRQRVIDRAIGRSAVDDEDLMEGRSIDAGHDGGDALALVECQREQCCVGGRIRHREAVIVTVLARACLVTAHRPRQAVRCDPLFDAAPRGMAIAISRDVAAPVLKVVCAWCNRIVTAAPRGAPVSHTICQRCLDWAIVHPTVRSGFNADGSHVILPPDYFGDGFIKN